MYHYDSVYSRHFRRAKCLENLGINSIGLSLHPVGPRQQDAQNRALGRGAGLLSQGLWEGGRRCGLQDAGERWMWARRRAMANIFFFWRFQNFSNINLYCQNWKTWVKNFIDLKINLDRKGVLFILKNNLYPEKPQWNLKICKRLLCFHFLWLGENSQHAVSVCSGSLSIGRGDWIQGPVRSVHFFGS